MATNTASYSFLLPAVSGDVNAWGGFLNSNWEDVDDLLDGTTPVDGIDIDSGSIDGTPIGAASASTGAFTNLSASGTVSLPSGITLAAPAITGALDLSGISNASTVRADLGLAIGTNVQAYDANTLFADTDDQLTAGFTNTVVDDGTKSSGTYTLSPSGGNYRKATNNGAFTLAAPTAAGDYTMLVLLTNGASAGAITTSGFDKETGAVFTTTNADQFLLHVVKIDTIVTLHVEALQEP